MPPPASEDEVPYAKTFTDLKGTPKLWLVREVLRLRGILNECWEAAGLLSPAMTGQYEQAWEEPTDLIPQIEELAAAATHCRENHPED